MYFSCTIKFSEDVSDTSIQFATRQSIRSREAAGPSYSAHMYARTTRLLYRQKWFNITASSTLRFPRTAPHTRQSPMRNNLIRTDFFQDVNSQDSFMLLLHRLFTDVVTWIIICYGITEK